ncbi:MAG: hypothetical protein PHR87_07855 [Sulfurospirillaceae bacterium]|nr:hypothetical protein [Sulfurospirillaceae bacterium]
MIRFILFSFFVLTSLVAQEVEIPRTAYQDIYKYYVLEVSKKANTQEITYRRQSHDAILFGKSEINCQQHAIRLLGTGASSKTISSTPSQWFRPPIRAVESDMINFVCHQ